MADKTGEQLSALVDGECELSEQEWMLKRLTRDADLKVRWQRYHMVSDAMKNNLPTAINTGFADRIRQVIDNDIPPLRTSISTIPPRFSWYKPVTGFALAASVAAVSVVGLQLVEQDDTVEANEQSQLAAATVGEEPPAFGNPRTSRLNSYLVNHNEYASRNSVQGVLPYVRIVGYDSTR
jgi:sigma-E factor negative regulatory protein RseA